MYCVFGFEDGQTVQNSEESHAIPINTENFAIQYKLCNRKSSDQFQFALEEHGITCYLGNLSFLF